jgi:hypothetical protein
MVGGGRGFGGGNNANSGVDTWVTSNCTAVDPTAYATPTATATPTGTASLYDCRH